ncbi:gliding motility-associated C-terminal domain-containing protein [Dyadobacter fermentans]|uniref:T9SS type B sorting domain-containing protein n=1 Tax=Dyadobacter fermentans TaxID=94254 RepID=UPI001CBE5139|nr:gliding motility-associated C-terminal domain-containing protein [Dyadobacter fermentans]MBZ1362195.1 gliding motility-associated C-terminal domain-containing protein [Dyadobacter fermentans]
MKASALYILFFFCSFLPFAHAQTGKQTYRFRNEFAVAQPECGPDLVQVKSGGSCNAGSSGGRSVSEVLPCGERRAVYHTNMNWGLMYPNPDGLVSETYTIQLYLKVTDWGQTRARIIDFSNGTRDQGIYFKTTPGNNSHCLELTPNGVIGECPYFDSATYYLLTFTRDGATGRMDIYVGNNLFTSFIDANKNYVGKAGVPIYVFRDDNVVSCESGEANIAYLSFRREYFPQAAVNKSAAEICFEANINPYADFSIIASPDCDPSKNVEVKYTGPIPAPGTGYDFKWGWDGAQVISGSGMGPYVLKWSTGGPKYVTLAVTSQACGNTLENGKQIVIGRPKLTAEVASGSCDTGTDGTITLTAADGTSPYQYSIDSVNYLASNTFQVPAGHYRVFVKDYNGCTTAQDANVTFTSDIIVSTMPDTTLCTGQSVALATTSNGQAFSWLPQNGLDNASMLEPVASPETTTEYVITATKGFCTQTDTVRVTVSPKIEVNVTPDALIEYNVPFQLNATSPQIRNYAAATFLWTPAIGLNNANIQSPVAVLRENQSYTVDVVSETGCKGTGQVNLSITRQESIIIPTAFSPNRDGKNEVLVPVVNDIESIRYFRIFNRWGQVVFFTNQLNTGWDGSFNGSTAVSGNYVWEIEGVSTKGKIISKKGAVMLLQ